MSDLVARLRDWQGIRMSPEKMAHFIAHAQEAADRIEQLEQEAAALRELLGDCRSALEPFGSLKFHSRIDAAMKGKE